MVAEVGVGSMAVLVVWDPALKALVPQEECRGEVTKEETTEVIYNIVVTINLRKLLKGNLVFFSNTTSLEPSLKTLPFDERICTCRRKYLNTTALFDLV